MTQVLANTEVMNSNTKQELTENSEGTILQQLEKKAGINVSEQSLTENDIKEETDIQAEQLSKDELDKIHKAIREMSTDDRNKFVEMFGSNTDINPNDKKFRTIGANASQKLSQRLKEMRENRLSNFAKKSSKEKQEAKQTEELKAEAKQTEELKVEEKQEELPTQNNVENNTEQTINANDVDLCLNNSEGKQLETSDESHPSDHISEFDEPEKELQVDKENNDEKKKSKKNKKHKNKKH